MSAAPRSPDYFDPVGLTVGGPGLPLCGGPLRFAHIRRRAPGAQPVLLPVDAVDPAALGPLTAPRPDWAGLPLDRPRIMGIVNVTPDSMSDGGDFVDADAAIAHGRALAAAGADILDVGGESTRPGAEPVPAEVELARVLPVVRALAAEGHRVSIDTRHAAVMTASVAAGAGIINDVAGLTGPGSLDAAVAAGVPVVLMHMPGDPQTMMGHADYADVTLEVADYLAARAAACRAAGIPAGHIAIDPGIGFGKQMPHNLTLLREAALLHGLGYPVLIGASRKGFIGRLGGGAPPKQRLGGSVAVALAAAARGVQLIRVHDVAETAQALAVWAAIAQGIIAQAI